MLQQKLAQAVLVQALKFPVHTFPQIHRNKGLKVCLTYFFISFLIFCAIAFIKYGLKKAYSARP